MATEEAPLLPGAGAGAFDPGLTGDGGGRDDLGVDGVDGVAGVDGVGGVFGVGGRAGVGVGGAGIDGTGIGEAAGDCADAVMAERRRMATRDVNVVDILLLSRDRRMDRGGRALCRLDSELDQTCFEFSGMRRGLYI